MRRAYINSMMNGGFPFFSDNFARPDGDLGNGWNYTAGLWTIASGAAIAAPGVGSELFANGSMETGDPPTGWSLKDGSTISSVADNRPGSSGTKALKGIIGTGNVRWAQATMAGSLSASGFYRTIIWGKNITTTAIKCDYGTAFSGVRDVTNSASWAEWTNTVRIGGTSATLTLYDAGSTGQECRVDDVSFTRLTLADCFAVKNFGYSNPIISAKVNMYGADILGLVFCLDSISNPQNFVVAYIAYIETVVTPRYKLIVEKCVGGTVTNLLSAYIWNYTVGQTLKITKQGQVVRAFYGGSQIGGDMWVTDAGVISNTLHGMFNTDPKNSIDDFASQNNLIVGLLNGNANSVFGIISEKTLWATSGSNDWLGRGSLCKSGSNWLLTYRAATVHSGDATAVYHIRFSNDEGVNWTAEDTKIGGGAVTGFPIGTEVGTGGVGEGVLIPAPNGDILFQCYDFGPNQISTQYRSTDGGNTWSDEGALIANTIFCAQDWCVVGTDIYITVLTDADRDNSHPWGVDLYKSSNNGSSWSKVSTIVSATTDGNEAGIQWVSGTRMICLVRGNTGVNKTWRSFSDDMGVTWSALEDVTDQLGILQKPRIKILAGGLLVHGRDFFTTSAAYTVVHFSSDGGQNWTRKFYPTLTAYVDCGYCDVLQKVDGSFYMVSYAGTSTSAVALKEYLFNIV